MDDWIDTAVNKVYNRWMNKYVLLPAEPPELGSQLPFTRHPPPAVGVGVLATGCPL